MHVQSAVSSEHHAAVLDALVENSFDSMMITEATSGNTLYANHAFTDLTGYSQEDALGKPPSLLQGP